MKAMKRAEWLATVVLMITTVALGGLLGRVWWIEKHGGQVLRPQLEHQSTALQPVTGVPGELRFADSTAAALSVRMYNLFADPAFIMDPGGKVAGLREQERKLTEQLAKADENEAGKIREQLAKVTAQLELGTAQVAEAKKQLGEALGPLLGRAPREVMRELAEHEKYPGTGKPRRFLWLAKEVDEGFYTRFGELKTKLHEESKEIIRDLKDVKDKEAREKGREKALSLYHTLDGVGFVPSMRRVYPLGPLAAHVLGYRNNYGGVEGMEMQLDDLLMGRPGQMLLLKDAQRNTLLVEEQGFKAPDHGCNVWLTLDTVAQDIAEDELGRACVDHRAESGCAVVMDAQTGRVLAMVSWPTFDPGKFQAATPLQRRNRAFDAYEPGSIFKPFVMAWALEKRVVRPTDVINCHFGFWSDPTGRAVKDTHGYGALSVEDVLIHSSNIGMAQIGWKMGIPTLHEAVKRFGFGERTGIEAPGDEKGIIRPLSQWNTGTLTSVPFGYEAAATPLQLVRAYATFANGGYLVTPRLLHAVEVKPGKVVGWEELAGPPVVTQILSTETAATMRRIMEGVYISGTAKGKASKIYRLFGKTGTAHLAVRGQGHYAGDLYNSSFLAGGPVSNPQLVAVVTLHKPMAGYYGGTVSAPACTAILERILQYRQVPGDQVEPPKKAGPLAGM